LSSLPTYCTLQVGRAGQAMRNFFEKKWTQIKKGVFPTDSTINKTPQSSELLGKKTESDSSDDDNEEEGDNGDSSSSSDEITSESESSEVEEESENETEPKPT
jgi:hypothetical protein